VCVAMKQATSRRDSLRRPGPDEFISRELVHFYFTIELRPAAEHSGLSTRAPAIWPITASFLSGRGAACLRLRLRRRGE
jgi:hypothetical protein